VTHTKKDESSVSSTNKTDRRDIAEILLTLGLNTMTLTQKVEFYFDALINMFIKERFGDTKAIIRSCVILKRTMQWPKKKQQKGDEIPHRKLTIFHISYN
jgi:hypothetical protein